jgi:hypothetical protein
MNEFFLTRWPTIGVEVERMRLAPKSFFLDGNKTRRVNFLNVFELKEILCVCVTAWVLFFALLHEYIFHIKKTENWVD